MRESIDHYQKNVDKKLIIRQRIFIVIILILIVFDVSNVWQGKIDSTLSMSGFLLASLIGLILSRMFKIYWHEEKGKVVSQLDRVGIVLLVLYIGIELARNWIFGHWLSGAMLTAFGLSILTGLLLGRFLGTVMKINKVLAEVK